MRSIQILRDRSLAIGHHRAAGVPLHVDQEVFAAGPDDARAVVAAAFASEPLAQAVLAQHAYGPILEHAGADAL